MLFQLFIHFALLILIWKIFIWWQYSPWQISVHSLTCKFHSAFFSRDKHCITVKNIYSSVLFALCNMCA
jgi:hypothetical protein